MNPFVLALDAPEATLATAGGKGANLSRLARARFPVPPGFVITTAAYSAFVQANGLEGRIVELGRAVPADDAAALADAARAIRRLFDEGTVPQAVLAAIQHAYRDLAQTVADEPGRLGDATRSTGDPSLSPPDATDLLRPGASVGGLAVAVRSSATAEDLPEASFAGQQETYLNVCDEAALLRAVRHCWASLWTARAMAYRARQGIDPAAVRLAVVVQRLVPADAAGILFTVNPLTDNSDEAVINAAWGLGEAIVGGRVMPDTVVTDKATGRLKHQELGDKAVMTVPAVAGTAEAPVAPERRRQPVLSLEQAAALTRLGRQIEAHFGGPQDIEWALAGGQIYVLQARPVTGLPAGRPAPPDPVQAVPGDDAWPGVDEWPAQPFDLWTRTNLGEIYPQPVSPLTWSGITSVVSKWLRYSEADLDSATFQIQWVKRFYGRVYFNEGALAHVMTQQYGLPGSFIHAVDAALGSRRTTDHRHQGRFRPIRFLRRLPVGLRIAVGRRGTDRHLQALFP